MIEWYEYDTLHFEEKPAEFFDKFIWKDNIWIACKLDFTATQDDIIWINPQYDSGPRNLAKLHYYYINNDVLLEPEAIEETDITWFRDELRWDYIYNILVCEPMEILTTDEIYDRIGDYLPS